MVFYLRFCLFATLLIVSLLAKDSEVKPFIDLINSSLDKPINEPLSKFLSEEENWNKFKSLISVDPEGVIAFHKNEPPRDLNFKFTNDLPFKLTNKGFIITEENPHPHTYAKFLKYSSEGISDALSEISDEDLEKLKSGTSKVSPKNFLIYVSILCVHLKLGKELEDAGDKTLTDFICDLKDPKIFVNFIHDSFKNHLLNEAKWSHDKDFYTKLKSAAKAKGSDKWDTLTKVLVFGGIALVVVVIIGLSILIFIRRRKNSSL
jgi:hypothetical protein